MYHSRESECLRENHHVRIVHDVELLARNLQTHNHKPRSNCGYSKCRHIRLNTQCLNPYKCFLKAQTLLGKLPEKWNPINELPEDYENVEPPLYDDTSLRPFNSKITQYGTLSDAFWVFTEGKKCYKIPVLRWNEDYRNTPYIKVFTDSSCVNNGDRNASAGSGIYVSEK